MAPGTRLAHELNSALCVPRGSTLSGELQMLQHLVGEWMCVVTQPQHCSMKTAVSEQIYARDVLYKALFLPFPQ